MIIPAYTVHVKISLNLKDLSVVSDDSIIMYIRLLGFQFIHYLYSTPLKSDKNLITSVA